MNFADKPAIWTVGYGANYATADQAAWLWASLGPMGAVADRTVSHPAAGPATLLAHPW